MTFLKAECGTVVDAKVLQLEKHREFAGLNSKISTIRTSLKRRSLGDLRAGFENADHETRHQLKGSDASTFANPKPDFGCLLGSQISAEGVPPDRWSDAVRALTAHRAQKPRIHTNGIKGKKNLCLSYHDDDKLSPADRFHEFFSLGTLRAHINKNHYHPYYGTSITGQLPIPSLCFQARPRETLEKHLAMVHNLKLQEKLCCHGLTGEHNPNPVRDFPPAPPMPIYGFSRSSG